VERRTAREEGKTVRRAFVKRATRHRRQEEEKRFRPGRAGERSGQGLLLHGTL